jgi:hypothetical protein
MAVIIQNGISRKIAHSTVLIHRCLFNTTSVNSELSLRSISHRTMPAFVAVQPVAELDLLNVFFSKFLTFLGSLCPTPCYRCSLVQATVFWGSYQYTSLLRTVIPHKPLKLSARILFQPILISQKSALRQHINALNGSKRASERRAQSSRKILGIGIVSRFELTKIPAKI